MIRLKKTEKEFSDINTSPASLIIFLVVCVENVAFYISSALKNEKDILVPCDYQHEFVRMNNQIVLTDSRKLNMFISGYDYISSSAHLGPLHADMIKEISSLKYGSYYDFYLSFIKFYKLPGNEVILFKSKINCTICS